MRWTVDIALVEAWGDALRAGDDQPVFTRMHRDERNIAGDVHGRHVRFDA